MLPRILLALGALAVLAAIAGFEAQSSADTLADNTGPSLIALQDLSSSVAEANAEATASFLATEASGREDRLHHNAYLAAMRRAAEKSEEVSSLIGPNPGAHEALQDASAALVTYGGRIEAARVANTKLPEAVDFLTEGIGVAESQLQPAIRSATSSTQGLLAQETGWSTWAARAAGVVALLSLIHAQMVLARRTRRILSPLLVIATVLTLVVLIMFERGYFLRDQAIADAETGGYQAIAATAEIQADAFALHSAVGLNLLDASSDSGLEARDALDLQIAGLDVAVESVSDGADSARERAAADELQQRWVTYRQTIDNILDEASSDGDAAATLFESRGVSSFNGFNTSIDSVLFDNRSQFTDALDDAAFAVRFLPFLGIILPVLAALAALLGIQRRLGEFR